MSALVAFAQCDALAFFFIISAQIWKFYYFIIVVQLQKFHYIYIKILFLPFFLTFFCVLHLWRKTVQKRDKQIKEIRIPDWLACERRRSPRHEKRSHHPPHKLSTLYSTQNISSLWLSLSERAYYHHAGSARERNDIHTQLQLDISYANYSRWCLRSLSNVEAKQNITRKRDCWCRHVIVYDSLLQFSLSLSHLPEHIINFFFLHSFTFFYCSLCFGVRVLCVEREESSGLRSNVYDSSGLLTNSVFCFSQRAELNGLTNDTDFY